MKKEEMAAIIVFILLVTILCAVVMWVIYDFMNSIEYTVNRKKMLNALEGILLSHYRGIDTKYCVKEIEVLFKHHIDLNNTLKRNYNNMGVLLEKYLVLLNSGTRKIVESDVDMDLLKKYILGLAEKFARENPMEQINGANNVLLHQLIECEKVGDKEKFNEIVNQLANEIKVMQDSIFKRDRKSKKQDIISIVGIILSIVFGAMTFIQFFV